MKLPYPRENREKFHLGKSVMNQRMRTNRDFDLYSLPSICLKFLLAIFLIGCAPNSHAQLCADTQSDRPYVGFESSGDIAFPIKDHLWHRAVKQIATDDGQHFLFKLPGANRKNKYFEIQTIPLGGAAKGFLAFSEKDGCGRLFDSSGNEFPLPHFQSFDHYYLLLDEIEVRRQPRILYSLSGLKSGGHRYVLFENGRIKAVSPRDYAGQASNIGSMHDWRLQREIVKDEKSGKYGVVSLQNLREIISLKWDAIERLTVDPDQLQFSEHVQHLDPKKRNKKIDYFWVTQTNAPPSDAQSSLSPAQNKSHFLYSHNGTRIQIAPFDKFVVRGWWFPSNAGIPEFNRAILEATNEKNSTCRIYTSQMKLLLDEDIPFDVETKKCPIYSSLSRNNDYFVPPQRNDKIKIYRTAPGPRLVLNAEVEGYLEFMFHTGTMVVRKATPEKPQYWVVGPDGKNLSDIAFTRFSNIGCDFIELTHEEKVFSLLPEGKLTERRFFPFGC